MRRTHFFGSAVIATVGVAVVASTATADVFFDRTDWVANTDSIVTPDYTPFIGTVFSDGVPVDLGGNFTVTAEGGNATLNQVPNFIIGFAAGGLHTVTFEFPEPINGFAAVWSNTFVQDGFTISTPFNDYDMTTVVSADFIGFTEDSTYTTVVFTAAADPGTDFIFFRDFEFAPVPAPGGSALLLCSAGLLARRRR